MLFTRLRHTLLSSLLIAGASLAAADVVVTRTGRSVEGTIISEDADQVLLQSNYGDLRFRKMDLKEIRRGGKQALAPAPTPAASGGAAPAPRAFGGYGIPVEEVDAAGGTMPAEGSAASAASTSAPPASADPFTDGAATTPSPAAAGPDPFTAAADPFSAEPGDMAGAPPPPPPVHGGGDPFNEPPPPPPPRGGGAPDPFGEEPSGAMQPPPAVVAQPADSVAKTPAPVFKLPHRTKPPIVDQGFDAVVYGIAEQAPVEIKDPGAKEYSSATNDRQLKVGSEVLTRTTKTARMMLRNKKDELRLPDDSHVVVEKLSPDSQEVTLFLDRGSIWSDVETRAKLDSFQIRTPELTAGVRGTRFIVDRVQGASRVSVLRGVVHVQSNTTGVFVNLKENEGAVVNASGQIMDLIATPVDTQKIWDDWDSWAQQTAGGVGSLAGGSPIASLSQQIAQDNAQWESDMQEYQRNVAQAKYQDKLNDSANAFLKFANGTGKIPDDAEAWSVLKFDTSVPGWKGPYVEGPVPPLDPWRRPLIYKKLKSQSGNTFGRVYSMGQDGRDQGGVNSSVDIVALVMYFNLDRFKTDPNVVAPQK
ncbi:hypothetical protein BH09SUM1_BH09SUM1_00060 [soil metagenome]